MENSERKSFSELVSELQASAAEVSSLAKNLESEREVFTEFSLLVEKFAPILNDVSENTNVMDLPPIRKAVECLHKELRRAKGLIRSSNSRTALRQIEDLTQDLGRSLGLMLFASLDLKVNIKEKIGALHKELMNTRFDFSSGSSSCPSQYSRPSSCVSRELEFVSETESLKDAEDEREISTVSEIEEERIILGADDVVLQLKYGDDEKLKLALLGLNDLINGELVNNEWIVDEEIIAILFNRLSSSKPHSRITIIQTLRSFAWRNAENKENMADAGSLSMLVKSLARDVEERRVAVGLLLEISDVSAVRRRLGRIQGCIVMLVSMLNGDDPIASHDAGKLLDSLSSNTQNVLHMAEAGYFKPLVQCLKEGTDMCKILMATAISRMELTDQSSASLGEEGAIEPLVDMFKTGKLESKLSALKALQNLSDFQENTQRLVGSGIVVTLLQLLFSVTSVLMTLREPASAILVKIAQSESLLVNQDVAQQMLSLLNLSSPVIQQHLLEALNSICAHSSASKARKKMKESGAFQLLLPFISESNPKIRTATLNLLCTLSSDLPEELAEQLGESHINTIVNIISTSTSESEKAAALSILSNLPISDKKVTDMLNKANFLPIIVSLMSSNFANSTNTTNCLAESVAGILIRFTAPNKKLQLHSAENGVIPLLIKLLSSGSIVAKHHAATSLTQLSQNSLSLKKSRKSRWFCSHPSSANEMCEVHEGYCNVKRTFCLVKAQAVSPMIKILQGKEREADEAVLGALASLLPDDIWENGSNYLVKLSAVQPIIKVLQLGNVKAQEKALWILERIFSIEEHRKQYGESAEVVLIDLAQNGNPRLKSLTAKLLAQLELLQNQSSYF